MNAALQRKGSRRRQIEGARPEEPAVLPGSGGDFSWFGDIPASFAYTKTEEQQQRQNLFMPPAFETNALEMLSTSYQDAPDPIRQSDFYAAGNKIRPWAHNRVANAGYLAIAEIEGVADDEFKTGKLSSEGYHVVPQYVLSQNPIDFLPLIPEGQYTTYGAQNELAPGMLSEEDGYLYG